MIWKYAKANQYTILTFDEDFLDLQNMLYYPPKIIWLRTGNINTKEIASLLFEDLKRNLRNFLLMMKLQDYLSIL